jgi:hypothetical protein
MINKNLLEKFNRLLQFLNHQDKYKNQFFRAVENSLFDFAIIIIWKVFILFAYEKIFQVAHQLGEDVFLQKWEGKFTRKPKNYRRDNLYWPNEEQSSDDQIIQFLGVIYKIDSNFISQLETLKKKRHVAAHVADLEFTEEDVDNYLFEMLRVVEKLQKCHADDYLENFSIDDFQKVAKMIPSSQDLKIFIDSLIDSLSQAGTFRAAEDYENRILHLKTFLTEEDIKKILNVVFDNPYAINQVLEAGGTQRFFRQIYDLGKTDKKVWLTFANRLVKHFGDRRDALAFYNWLFLELGMKTYEEEIGLKDIPF